MRRKKRSITKFLIRMQKKLVFIFLAITLLLSGLIARLAYIQYNRGRRYEKIVLSQQGYDSRIIPYRRGDIVDSKGTILATCVDVYNVVLDCKVLNQQEEGVKNATAQALEDCFPKLKKEDVFRTLEANPDGQYEVLQEKQSRKKVQAYQELLAKEEEEEKNRQKGSEPKKDRIHKTAVWFEKEYIRKYPYGSLAASVVGFASGGNVGTLGLEQSYNSTLNGINGRTYGYLNADNNFEKTVRDAKDGNTIVTTIDAHIQSVVEEKIALFNKTYANHFVEGDGSLNMAAIVMNPQNGEVYAMADYPGFDLNQPRKAENYFSAEELAPLSEEEKLEKLNELWKNFCISYTYEPGSTVKPLTVACGLDTGTLSGQETYLCDGLEVISKAEVHCVNRMGHGMETVEKAIMDSCNDALMQMSYSIGGENFYAYQDIFGFGKKTGIDLPGEEKGQLNQSKKQLDLATNVFGQNFNCTMIQLAAAFSSLINGGKYYQPHVVKKILDSSGSTIETMQPVLLKETASQETSDQIREYLYRTVSEGTGKTAKVNGYSMGGKTGTAQKLPRDAKNYLVSFIGYVPQENPQLVIYLIIDQPNVEEQAHSSYAQEVVKEILQDILPYMNLYPDEELQPEEPDQAGAPQEITPQEPQAEPPADPLGQ